jgi:hypothetical protein
LFYFGWGGGERGKACLLLEGQGSRAYRFSATALATIQKTTPRDASSTTESTAQHIFLRRVRKHQQLLLGAGLKQPRLAEAELWTSTSKDLEPYITRRREVVKLLSNASISMCQELELTSVHACNQQHSDCSDKLFTASSLF